MDTTVKERLIAYINYKGLSKHKFESICGLSSRYVSNISKSIQPAIVEKISLNFPDLNMGWVLTGYGNMFNEQPIKKESAPEVFPSADAMKLYLEMMETIRIQAETIKKLTEGDESQKRAII
jgi:hypothetical protein